jgi:hypothetical protein
LLPPVLRRPMILNAIAEKLKRRSKDDFKGRDFEITAPCRATRSRYARDGSQCPVR